MKIEEKAVEVEKTVKVKEKTYVLTMNKDEAKLLFYFVNNCVGGGYWRTLSDSMYNILAELGLESDNDVMCDDTRIQLTDVHLEREC